MATAQHDLKQRVLEVIGTLPDDALAEVAAFVEYQRYKIEREQGKPPFTPVPLVGSWTGLGLTTEDLDAPRREMWEGFGERDL